jgi:hypothetical protein
MQGSAQVRADYDRSGLRFEVDAPLEQRLFPNTSLLIGGTNPAEWGDRRHLGPKRHKRE